MQKKGQIKLKMNQEGKPGAENRSNEDLKREAAQIRHYFEEYEKVKMNIEKGSKWYIISLDWLNNWKAYVGYEGDEEMEKKFPGPITNEDILDDDQKEIIEDKDILFQNLNLRDNLREDQHFTILNEDIWKLLLSVYGGREILRFGVIDENGREFIEVNLIKVYTYFFPRPDHE